MRPLPVLLSLAALTSACGLLPGSSPNFQNAVTQAEKAAGDELHAAAAAHGVTIQEDRSIYSSVGGVTLLHAPLAGINAYGDDDFSAGAPIQLLIVHSGNTQGLPDGSYVVKAQHEPGATEGQAIFIGADGAEAGRRTLLIRTAEQAAVLFPGPYGGGGGGGPAEIPNITSTHVFIIGKDGKLHEAVDCSGWQPYRTIYYAVN
ncbi:MAG TPA: hypothetical protein VIG99_13010 [Myxococcaceae bacterium]|jgi:hypothetical protein